MTPREAMLASVAVPRANRGGIGRLRELDPR